MPDNPFVLAPSSYKRDLNVLKFYVEDQATYLNKMTGKPMAQCVEFVKAQLKPGGQFEFKDPKVLFLEREENGDREKKVGTLLAYLNESIRDEQLISPTGATYINPKKLQSVLVDYIDTNVKARGKAKKEKFSAEMEANKAEKDGDMPLFKLKQVVMAIKELEQVNRKLANNAISGAHVSPSTPLYNKSAHSTLTSTCRVTSGYGNANNEKLLNGNRHYWAPHIVRNNIISIINHTNYEFMEATMKEFGMRCPTVAETMECIKYSAQLYWWDRKDYARIEQLVQTLSDMERAAFVYTGDLYHIMRFNDGVVRQFITKLATRVGTVDPTPDATIHTWPEEYVHLAAQICPGEMKGMRIADVKGTDAHGILASTTNNIGNTILEYGNFIRAFFVTENLPASVAFFPDSVRRAALISDTDSTIFTVQDWVEWMCGTVEFGDRGNAVSATMIFLAAQTIVHVLARISANFGIAEDRIHQIAMKNEFKFDVLVPTQVAKHYFAMISCQEGNLFAKYKEEIKGVHLKASNAPIEIMKKAKKMMLFIMNEVMAGRKIKLKNILKEIADIERGIFAAIAKGDYAYFRMGQIKPPESYTKSAEESPYAQYMLWNEVFGPKYGIAPPPPYMCVKVATDVDSPTKTREWIASMEDRELAGRLQQWMTRNNKKYIGSLQLPEQCVASNGIPKEILDVAGVRRIVLDCTRTFYIILESLGVFMANDKITKLCSDMY